MERHLLICSVKHLLKRQEGCPGQDGETGVDVCKSTYSNGKKVVLGSMEKQVLICSVKTPTQKAGRWSWAGWRDRC
jgi:hypothetical protein